MDAINNPSLSSTKSHKNSTSDNIKREAVLEPSVLIQNAEDHLVSAPLLYKDGGLDPIMNGINGYEFINLPPLPFAGPLLLSSNPTVRAPSSFTADMQLFPGNHQLNQLPRSHATPVTTTTYAGFNCNYQPRFRARRGQATDPHSVAERHRREKISDRIKKLHDLIPNSNKTDKVSMLDEIIKYIEFLQLKIKDSSDISSSASAGSNTVVPEDVTPDLESTKRELCLMPVELASVISTLKGKRTAVIPTEGQVTDSALNVASLFANDGRGK